MGVDSPAASDVDAVHSGDQPRPEHVHVDAAAVRHCRRLARETRGGRGNALRAAVLQATARGRAGSRDDLESWTTSAVGNVVYDWDHPATDGFHHAGNDRRVSPTASAERSRDAG